MMKVCMLTQVFPRWEEDIFGRFIYILARELVKDEGLSINVIAPHEKELLLREHVRGIAIERFRYAPCRFEEIAYKGDMAGLVKKNFLNKIIFLSFLATFLLKGISSFQKERYDVIHAHWILPAGFVGMILSSLFNKPLLITCHGTDVRILASGNVVVRFIGRMVLGRAKKIVTVSNYLKDQLCEIKPDIFEKIDVVPMPVDTEKIFPVQMDKKDKKVVLCVARLHAQKSIDTLIKAVAILKGRVKPFDLYIVGEGSEREYLEKLVIDLALQSRVKFLDNQPPAELNRLYNLCDLLVLPSENEGCGLVLLEAMLCGKPVVGADSGGIKDIIVDGENGYLFPVKSEKELASKLGILLNDDCLVETMGKKGKELATNFVGANVSRHYYDIYREFK